MENVSEIYLCDEKLNLIATIYNFNNIEWTDKFYEADNISITIPFEVESNPKSEMYSYYKNIYDSLESIHRDYNAKIIFILTNTSKRIGFVENFSINEKKSTLSIKGRGALAILSKRFTKEKSYIPGIDTKDYVGSVMCKIINDNEPFNIFRVIEKENEIGEEIFTSTKLGDNVYKKLTSLSELYDVGISSLYDKESSKIIFKTLEKSTVAINAISSDDGNLLSNVYKCDIGKYANHCVVIGETLKNSNTPITVEVRTYRANEGESEENYKDKIFKIFKKSNLKLKKPKDGSEGNISESDIEEYKKLLIEEGKEELAKNQIEESYDIDISEDVDVKVGDMLVVKLNVGYKEIVKNIIVSEIKHSYTKNGYSREASFGKPIDMAYELKRNVFLMD